MVPVELSETDTWRSKFWVSYSDVSIRRSLTPIRTSVSEVAFLGWKLGSIVMRPLNS